MKDAHDRIDDKPQRQHHTPNVDHREVTPGAVNDAKKPGLDHAQKTVQNYFGAVQIHDSSAPPLEAKKSNQPGTSEHDKPGGHNKDAFEKGAPGAKPQDAPQKPVEENRKPGDDPRKDRDDNSPDKGDKQKEAADKQKEATDKQKEATDKQAELEDQKKSRAILDHIASKDKNVSQEFLDNLKSDLSKLPSKDLKKLEDNGIKIRAVTKLPGDTNDGGGPGVFDGRKVYLSENGITTFPDGRGGDMKNDPAARGMAGAHEVGHALSQLRGQEKGTRDGLDSSDRGFREAELADRKAGWKGIKSGNPMQDEQAKGLYKYHATQREEAYAQAYSMESKLTSPEEKKIWQQQFPRTSAWMHRNQQKDLEQN